VTGEKRFFAVAFAICLTLFVGSVWAYWDARKTGDFTWRYSRKTFNRRDYPGEYQVNQFIQLLGIILFGAASLFTLLVVLA
jgi:hypothetical protein